MSKTIAIIGDQDGQVTKALVQVTAGTGRTTCARLASGGESCKNGVCEEGNPSCIGTRVTDYSHQYPYGVTSTDIDHRDCDFLKTRNVPPHLPDEGISDQHN